MFNGEKITEIRKSFVGAKTPKMREIDKYRLSNAERIFEKANQSNNAHEVKSLSQILRQQASIELGFRDGSSSIAQRIQALSERLTQRSNNLLGTRATTVSQHFDNIFSKSSEKYSGVDLKIAKEFVRSQAKFFKNDNYTGLNLLAAANNEKPFNVRLNLSFPDKANTYQKAGILEHVESELYKFTQSGAEIVREIQKYQHLPH